MSEDVSKLQDGLRSILNKETNTTKPVEEVESEEADEEVTESDEELSMEAVLAENAKLKKALEQRNNENKNRREKTQKVLTESEQTINSLKTRLLRTEALAALQEAGAADAKRLIKYIRVDELDFDGDEVVGLEDQIEDLKLDFAESFKRKPGPKPATETQAGPKKEVTAKKSGLEGALNNLFRL